MYHVCDECVCVACPNQKRIAGRLCNTKQYMNATSNKMNMYGVCFYLSKTNDAQ